MNYELYAMAFHFSANQYEKQYVAKRLGNWEQPKWYPPRPRQRKGSTKIICNNAGHLLLNYRKADNNPWGNFRSTYQLPDKLTRSFADEYQKCLTKRDKWNHFISKNKEPCVNSNHLLTETVNNSPCPTKCKTMERVLSLNEKQNNIIHPCEKKESFDLKYTPGDLTSPKHQHISRNQLLQQKYDLGNFMEPNLPLDKLNLEDQLYSSDKLEVTHPPLTKRLTTPLLYEFEPINNTIGITTENMVKHFIAEKPNASNPSPIVPAFSNFEIARRMHNENLEHRPLPDCIADKSFRRLQSLGGHGGLALDLDPIASGITIKTHGAGPTHCTKMKVFRPKTCGVVPKVFNKSDTRAFELHTPTQNSKKMGAMDLAICWDYKPADIADEPRPAHHIDGSNDTAGPAVFNCVESARPYEPSAIVERSGGIFNNTSGELDFFDKDVLRRKSNFNTNIAHNSTCDCGVYPHPPNRAHSASREDFNNNKQFLKNRYENLYQSSPNIMSDQDLKNLRRKYLCESKSINSDHKRINSGFLGRKHMHMSHKVAPCELVSSQITSFPNHKPPLPAFRVGVPHYNAAGQFLNSDGGCNCNRQHAHRNVVVVPRPRDPFRKGNYKIKTLVPPFQTYNGSADFDGYPDHWRLTSVYQRAFKPIEQRQRSLLQTIYK